MLPLVSAEQMRAIDADTIVRLKIPGAVLMENAGRGVLSALWLLKKQGALDLYGHQVVVVAGPGNNGGDGMVIGRYLHNHGVAVRILLCAERERVRGDALLHLQAAENAGATIVDYGGEAGAGQVASLLQRLSRQDIIIDALLGTGLKQAVSGPLRHIILAINHSPAVKIAVDLPSGLDADCGVPQSKSGEPTANATPAIVRADYTLTLGQPKLGLCGAPGFTYAGSLFVIDIGIPESLCALHGVRARLLDARCLLRLEQPRHPLGHKGSHGHLLIIAGSRGKSGAALLATRAALRTGVGLCTLAAPLEIVDTVLGGHVLEAMTYPYSLGHAGSRDAGLAPAPTEGSMESESAPLGPTLLHALEGKQALAIGPGLPTGSEMKQALLEILRCGTVPMVLDADALNLLVGETAALREAARHGQSLILTPHPGEAARLLGQSVAEVQADRTRSAQRLCQRTGAIVVLKGARTVIVAPDAEPQTAPSSLPEGGAEALPSQNGPLSISPTGNAGMGSGGMGDVLTGMIGSLLASGWLPYDAACAGVYWHGLAGDILQARRPPGALLLAGELIDTLDAARQQALKSAQASSDKSGWPVSNLC